MGGSPYRPWSRKFKGLKTNSNGKMLIHVCLIIICNHRIELTASPFADLEKATVLQECRVFSDSKVVTESPRKCSQLITKLLHIVTQGDAMSSSEVTKVFFGVTKLFQSNDASLRRMVYFFIKEVHNARNEMVRTQNVA